MTLFKTPLAMTAMLLVVTLSASAQKLPTTQQASLRAPANIKIDGKTTEWDDQFQAYNKAGIFYTISNDDENLYLVIKETDPRLIEKTLDTGIFFTVNGVDAKNLKEKTNVSVGFPEMSRNYVLDILRKAGDKTHWSGLPASMFRMPRMQDVTTRTDSTVRLATLRLQVEAKNILVAGITNIPDKSISVYNENGIKAVAAFNNQGNYIYELAVPLKYLKTGASKLTYNIRINGYDTGGMIADRATKTEMPTDPDIASPTDFWGEYTLAKK